MCGITGLLRKDRPIEDAELLAMTAAIKHRGPDGHGFWYDPSHRIGFGHRRLALIDLAGGAQPMYDDTRTIQLVFNGEIYNYLQLKQELQGYGHHFSTNSDTEAIIYAYKQWGKDCVKRLRGMFAFVLADNNKRELFLARDHFGIKPMYYYEDENCFAFGSEIQAIKALPGLQLNIDWSTIDQYLWLQYIPHPQTAFKKLKKLPPAHTLTIGYDGQMGTPQRYWQFEFKAESGKSEQDWLEELDATLRDSVQAHLLADVPFGAFLSGGIDSSLVVSYMAEHMNSPVKTFSIGFKEKKYNELEYAAEVAKKWGTEHHVEIVEPQGLDILPDLVRHYGEPFADSSAIPTWYVSRLARRHVTMTLTGDGGDELFAGYGRYVQFAEQQHLFPLNRKKIKSFLYPFINPIDPYKYPNNVAFWEGKSLRNLMEYIRIVPFELRKRLLKSGYQQYLQYTPPLFESSYAAAQQLAPTNLFQQVDINTYLPLDILTKVDVASMMHSLEVRPPLIDVQVAELATRIPSSFNLAKVNGKYEGKILLKKLLNRHFSHDFVYREKKGFAVPLEFWFGGKGSQQDYLREKLLSRDSMLKEAFDQKAIEKMLQYKHFSSAIWSLLVLEEWLRQNR
jgi:asparagine synthase (glutamine-hydrolysing)